MHIRIFDFCFSLLCLCACAPLLLIIALLVKTTSPGPAIFTQLRVGLHGNNFVIFKFRTMYTGSETYQGMINENSHPLITPIGRFLRSTHLDELPQLLNVLVGTMSLVGPRPVTLCVAQERTMEVPCYMDRHQTLPGITGLAQIKGRLWNYRKGPRCVHKLNMFYVKRKSLLFNIKILVCTIPVMIMRKGI